MKRAGRVVTILLTLVMLTPIGAPLVAADTGDVPVNAIFSATPDGAFPYSQVMNWANASDMSLSNYNKTWIPFYAANPDITGVTVTPFPTPAVILQSGTSIEAVQRVRFTENDVLDGVSQSWWRSPIGNAPAGSTVTFKLYRADSSTVNVTTISGGQPTFSDPSLVQQVWQYTGPASGGLDYLTRHFSTGADYYDTPTWINVTAGLQDAEVRSDMPASARGLVNELNVQAATPTEYAYFQYDLSGIPAGSQIIAANLSLDRWEQFAGGVLSTYRPQASWTEAGITWNNQPGVDTDLPLSSSVVDCPFPGFGYLCMGDHRISINVTQAVAADSALSTTRGLRLMYNPNQPLLNSSESFSNFWPREQPDASLHPTLWIQYAPIRVSYNFTFDAVYAPLFPNKDYYAYWEVTNPTTHQFHLYYTSGDMNNDGLYQSWTRLNGGSMLDVPVDLDQSVVMTRGMSSGIAGLSLDCAHYGQTCSDLIAFNVTTSYDRALWFNDSWMGNQQITNAPGQYVYFNLVVPFVNTNGTAELAGCIGAVLHFSDAADLPTSCRNVYWNQTFSVTVQSFNLSAEAPYVGKHLTRADVELALLDTASNGFVYLSAQQNMPESALNFFAGASAGPWLMTRYALYGYFSADNFFFDNTDKSIVLIPVEQPDSELGILQAWQQWQAEATFAQAICNIAFFLGHIPLATIPAQILDHDCAVQGMLDGQSWVLNTVFKTLASFFSPISDFLYAVGAFIWTLITFFIQAVQWFLYWGLKIINIFIVMIVWIIVFMAPNYVGKAFQVWAQQKFSTAAMRRTLQEGWSTVWSVVQLVFSLVMIAVGAGSFIVGLLKP